MPGISSPSSRGATSPSLRRSYTGSGLVKLGRPVRTIEHARRPGQTVVLAQHRPGVFGAEPAAPLQDRDHLSAEGVKLCGQQGRHDVEPVRGTVGEPVYDQRGNLFWRPCGDKMPPRAGEIAEQLPQCRLVAPDQIEDHLGAAARRFYRGRVREISGGERAIERQMREIKTAKAARQPLAPDLRIGELVDLAR